MTITGIQPAPAKPIQPADLDIAAIRADFPLLQTQCRGQPLVYLDNAATSQKPQAVIAAMTRYYTDGNANIHRGVYKLSEDATAAYEGAREKIARFINAPSAREIVFVRGATEAINLVAATWGVENIRSGDEIILSEMEHHSNIVPWQLLAQRTGAVIKVIPISDAGELLMDQYQKLLSDRTRLVAVTYVSNVMGTINPIERIVTAAHARGIPVLIDGAQSISHLATDVQTIGCDFFVISGHKMCGPTGIGVLWAKGELLEKMPPYQGGGDMISTVSFAGSTWNEVPHKFEAGTPHIAGAIGLGVAVDYLCAIGMDVITRYEDELLIYATKKLSLMPGVRIIGTAPRKAAVISFVMDDIHPHDIGTIMDGEGVAIRTGHHCCQPVMDHFHIPATARASLAFYNTRADIDRLVAAITKVKEVFH
ncbi:MAG: cysteine desulfurase [Phycisphaerae bacterium]